MNLNNTEFFLSNKRMISNKRMTGTMILLICLMLVVIPYNVIAGDIKIGYIDSARIFREFKGTQEAQTKFDKEAEKWEREATRLQQELEAMKNELESQSLMLSKEKKQEKMRQLEEKKAEYESYVTRIWGTGGEAEQRNTEFTQPIIEQINAVLERIGKEDDFTIIFDAIEGNIVYANPMLDLTDRVIDELNREAGYQPALEKERKLAILPLNEKTIEAKSAKLSSKVGGLLRQGLDITEFFETAEDDKIEKALQQLGYTSETEFTVDRAVETGMLADADLVVLGNVVKTGADIKVELKLVDVWKKITLVTTEKQFRDEQREFERAMDELTAELVTQYEKSFK